MLAGWAVVLPRTLGFLIVRPGGWARSCAGPGVLATRGACWRRDLGGRCVNDARKLTPWRRLNLDPLMVCWFSFVGGCGGDAAEVSVLEPVAVAFEGDDFGVVDEPVDHGGGDHVVAEYLAPAAEDLVGGDDEAGPFVARGDQLEEQVRRFGFERDVADLIDDQ